jgi:hypothetical protein
MRYYVAVIDRFSFGNFYRTAAGKQINAQVVQSQTIQKKRFIAGIFQKIEVNARNAQDRNESFQLFCFDKFCVGQRRLFAADEQNI